LKQSDATVYNCIQDSTGCIAESHYLVQGNRPASKDGPRPARTWPQDGRKRTQRYKTQRTGRTVKTPQGDAPRPAVPYRLEASSVLACINDVPVFQFTQRHETRDSDAARPVQRPDRGWTVPVESNRPVFNPVQRIDLDRLFHIVSPSVKTPRRTVSGPPKRFNVASRVRV
jgi:hypothetical protein